MAEAWGDIGETGGIPGIRPVYLFTESGSYLGTYKRTDQYGNVLFTIPVKSYKFRVDYDGTQYWSNVINVIADEEQIVELPLDQLALNQTNNPNQKRFDGMPPKHERNPVTVASLGSLTGLLTRTIIAQTGSDAVYYFINDHLGTPQRIMDENNEIVWEADYKPFGETNITINTLDNNFRFPGQYYDEETGLHYNWHRYYEPGIGRYLRGDPSHSIQPSGVSISYTLPYLLSSPQELNLYSYCLNDSVNWVDPEGLKRVKHGPNWYDWHYEYSDYELKMLEERVDKLGQGFTDLLVRSLTDPFIFTAQYLSPYYDFYWPWEEPLGKEPCKYYNFYWPWEEPPCKEPCK